jgi:hypothetical protein
MSIYYVLRASLYRKTVITTVLVKEAGGNHGGHGSDMEVEGMNGLTVRCRGGRIVWNEDNTISKRLILFIEPPDFPVGELKGRRLLSDSRGSDVQHR